MPPANGIDSPQLVPYPEDVLAASCSDPRVEWRRFLPPLQMSVESIWGVSDPPLEGETWPHARRGVAHAQCVASRVWPAAAILDGRDGIVGERLSGFAANRRSGK